MTTTIESESQNDRRKTKPTTKPVAKTDAGGSASMRKDPGVMKVVYVEWPQNNPLIVLSQSPTHVLVHQIRAGVDGALVRGFLDDLKIPTPSFAESVGISPRTLVRRYHEHFKGEDAAKVVRYAKVFSLAIETFGAPDKAYSWLERPNRTLPDNATPASLLDTEFGAEEVVDSLHRIQHGVFS